MAVTGADVTVTNVFQIPLATAPLCGRCRRNTRSRCKRCDLPICGECVHKVACPRGSLSESTSTCSRQKTAMADAMRARTAAVPGTVPADPTTDPSVDPSASAPLGFADFFRLLPKAQRTLLRHVARYSAVPLRDLQSVINTSTNNGVAGVISGITKNARRVGIDPSLVLRSGVVRQNFLYVPACYGGSLLRQTQLPPEEECTDDETPRGGGG